MVATLTSTGTPAAFLHPVEGLHGDLGMVTAKDVILAISNSGETSEILNLLPSLQTGMVNGYSSTPLASLAFQWFGLAPNMANLRYAPLTGATVIEKRAWDKIPAELRPKLLEASRAAGQKLRFEIRRLNQEAIAVMVKNGLKIHNVNPPRSLSGKTPRHFRGIDAPAVGADRVRSLPLEASYDTLGGLVTERLGNIPHRGDTVSIDGSGLTITVIQMLGRRVGRVKVTVPRPAAGEG
jgi:hypothetical protein